MYSITLKVPFSDYEKALQEVSALAELKSMSVNAYDLTAQYQDTKAYLENYKKERARLDELYGIAEKIEDLIKVEERLTQLQNMIDNYEAQLKNMERRTDYGSISVTLREKKEIIESYYEMTGLRVLLKNFLLSFDSVFVFLSNIIAWVILVGIVYGGYRLWTKKRK